MNLAESQHGAAVSAVCLNVLGQRGSQAISKYYLAEASLLPDKVLVFEVRPYIIPCLLCFFCTCLLQSLIAVVLLPLFSDLVSIATLGMLACHFTPGIWIMKAYPLEPLISY